MSEKFTNPNKICILYVYTFFLNNDIQFTKLVFICCLFKYKFEYLTHTSCIHACIIKQYKKEIFPNLLVTNFSVLLGPAPVPKYFRNKTCVVWIKCLWYASQAIPYCWFFYYHKSFISVYCRLWKEIVSSLNCVLGCIYLLDEQVYAPLQEGLDLLCNLRYC